MSNLQDSTPVAPLPRGVHHLVLNTDDIKATIDFYWGLLGMPLIHGMRLPVGAAFAAADPSRGHPPFAGIRHYFFDMGGDSLLAFFEIPKGAREAVDRNGVAGMQHLAFSITPSKAAEVIARLDAAGVSRIGPLEAEPPGCFSTYFFDPQGVRLEMTYHTDHGDQQTVVRALTQDREQLVAELSTVCSDENWLKWVAPEA